MVKGVTYVMHPTAKPNKAILSICYDIKGLMVNRHCDKFGDNISCSDRSMGFNTSNVTYVMCHLRYARDFGLFRHL